MKESDEIVVGANGSIYVAPVGTAIAATIDAPLAEDWVDLGYVTEDGVSWTDGKTLQSIRAWQSFYDLRRVVESKEGSLGFTLMQWSGQNVTLAFGGGTVTESALDSGFYLYEPPDPASIDERAMAVEWSDGAKDYRLVFPKGMVSENVETNLQRTAASLLPISFSLLGQDAVNPFELYTNDPAFADVSTVAAP